ncbi:MAG: Cof-type HAD-IIB family hydrolase [Clostridia bacterium]
MKYKLVASDFDDTLLPPSMLISSRTIETIKRFTAKGGKFVLCTGRMHSSIMKEAQIMGLKGEIISYQGALTKDIESGKILNITEIPQDLAVEYVKYMQSLHVVIQLYVGDRLCIEKENRFTASYVLLCKVTAEPVGDLVKFLLANVEPVFKILCYTKPEQCAEIRKQVKSKFGDRLLINSSKPWNVEAVSIKTSKGDALRKLCEKYGIDRREVLACGDNLNDLEMINYAGFGVAVGNAVEELKKNADYVTASCDEDGVAQAIEKFCLDE